MPRSEGNIKKYTDRPAARSFPRAAEYFSCRPAVDSFFSVFSVFYTFSSPGNGPAFDRTGKRVYNRKQYFICGNRTAAAARSGAGKERMPMDSKLFRKESLEKISSPEALHE